jgi:hypothetical protein
MLNYTKLPVGYLKSLEKKTDPSNKIFKAVSNLVKAQNQIDENNRNLAKIEKAGGAAKT